MFLTLCFINRFVSLAAKVPERLIGFRSKNARVLISAVKRVSKIGPIPKAPFTKLCCIVNLEERILLVTSISKKSTPLCSAFLACAGSLTPWAIIFTYLTIAGNRR